LQEPAQVAAAWSGEYWRVIQSMALCRADDAWREQMYREALERGEEYAADWLKVVPVSCVQGRHYWRRHFSNGIDFCRYCDTSQERVTCEPAPREWRNRSDKDAEVSRS
jgi:hypothetical protein